MNEQGDLNKLMNKEICVSRESIFKFKFGLEIRVWRDEILNASSQDVMESYSLMRRECLEICSLETSGPKIAFRILNLSKVNAVEVYDRPNIGIVLYKDWP